MLEKSIRSKVQHIQLLSSLISDDNAFVIGNAISSSSNLSSQVTTPNERENKYVFLFLFERPFSGVVGGNAEILLFVSVTHLSKEIHFQIAQIIHSVALLEIDVCDSLVAEPLPKLLSSDGSLIQSVADQSSGELLQAFFFHSLERFTQFGFFLLGYGVALNDLGIDQVSDCIGVELNCNRAEDGRYTSVIFKKIDTRSRDFSMNFGISFLIFIHPTIPNPLADTKQQLAIFNQSVFTKISDVEFQFAMGCIVNQISAGDITCIREAHSELFENFSLQTAIDHFKSHSVEVNHD